MIKMNWINNQSHPKKRRGIATVVGSLIFTILIVATFSVLSPTLKAQTDLLDSSKIMFDEELVKHSEEFTLISSTDISGKLVV